MAFPGVVLLDPSRDARPVVVDHGHLRVRIAVVIAVRNPVDGVVGPQRLPLVVGVLVGQPRLVVDNLLALAHQLGPLTPPSARGSGARSRVDAPATPGAAPAPLAG